MGHNSSTTTNDRGRSVTRTRQLFELSLDDMADVGAKAANLGVLSS
jgi:hypothetical protein